MAKTNTPMEVLINPFTVARACWVIGTRWWGVQKFVWEFKVN